MFFINSLPRVAVDYDFVDKINGIFTLIDSHNHVDIGNAYSNNSINFTILNMGGVLNNLNSSSFYAMGTSDVSTFSSNYFLYTDNRDLYFKKLTNSIQITKFSSVASLLSINGIRGNFDLYQIQALYNSSDQSYTFSLGSALADIKTKNLTVSTLDTILDFLGKLTTNNKPQIANSKGVGYLWINNKSRYNYTVQVIDNTTKILADYFMYTNTPKYNLAPFNKDTSFGLVGSFQNYYKNDQINLGGNLYWVRWSTLPVWNFVVNGQKVPVFSNILGNTRSIQGPPFDKAILHLQKGWNTSVFKVNIALPTVAVQYFLKLDKQTVNVTTYTDFMYIDGNLQSERVFIVSKFFCSADELTLNSINCLYLYTTAGLS